MPALIFLLCQMAAQIKTYIHKITAEYIHTNLYSAKNRVNESKALAQDD